ncbi:MAG TPA: PAS domain-containing protein, partial [Chitinophagaceae bacterium]|nr:PAS domain-containing protein [Chitinophagaceae bacterium]
EDTPVVRSAYSAAIAEKRPFDFYYRIHSKDGKLKILHARGNMVLSDSGEVAMVIGTSQDVTEKQTLIRNLEHSRLIHQQAESLANIGSWTWDLKADKIEWSEQMYHIYDLQPDSNEISFELFKCFVHPDDIQRIDEAKKNIYEKHYADYQFRIITPTGKVRMLHTVARMHMDAAGMPAYIVGAEQDITEKEKLVEKLRQNESVYKQAEELANMGNWSWDVKENRLEWTDHLYRIYGLEPNSEEITMERFLSFVHPDDRQQIKKDIDNIAANDLVDHTFRIVTREGKTRILRSVSQVQRNEHGDPVFVIGTERDITDKQTLIDKLTRSEKLYKQAQALAHVGNWSWHIPTNSIEWSDELYRIYGIEPSGQLSYEEYITHIHPDDREKVQKQVAHAMKTGESWEFTHKLIRNGNELRIVHATGEVMKDEKG